MPPNSIIMKIKSIKTSYTYKKLKDFKIGDSVVTTDGLKAKVLDIHKEGTQKTFKITLSDGRTFRTAGTHCSTVHFRNSKQRPDKKVYDCVTTNYIKENLDKYLFEIPTDDTFSLSEIDFIQHLEMLPQHEAEPVELKDILPDLEKDSKKVYIEKIEELSEEECWCLSLNDPLGLYLTEQGIFTHNSLLTNLIMSYIITLFCLMREPYKVLGHSQPIYEKVKLPDGKYTTIADLEVGMKIAGVTQEEAEVLEIIEQGEKETLELQFANGKTCRCSKDHLWTVYDLESKAYKVKPTYQILENPELYAFPEEEDCIKDELQIRKAETLFETFGLY